MRGNLCLLWIFIWEDLVARPVPRISPSKVMQTAIYLIRGSDFVIPTQACYGFLCFSINPDSIDFSAKSHHSTTVYFPSLLSPYYNRVSPNFHIKFFFPMFGMVRTQADPSLGPLRSRHDLDNSRKSNHF